jgi:hypothetical protein
MMFRGGAEHEGVEFRLQNSFFFSAINNPPLEPAERSRMAFCSLGKLDPDKKAKSLTIDADSAGRMMLRALMDGWKDLDKMIAQWRDALSAQGMDSRAQDTYGTLLAIAHLLLGDEAMEKAGLGVENIFDAGHKIARWTSNDRAEASENWRLCLEHILDCTIEAWKGGEKPTVGNTIASWESGEFSTKAANERLNLIGLAARGEDREGAIVREEDLRPSRHLLAVPLSSVQLGRLFAGTKWSGGVWGSALKQAPADVVIRDRGNGQNMKINRKSARCLYVDLRAYDAKVKEEEG